MNGLRYIRTRCNLSINELADILSVTRQAVSAWENGKKDIPEQRRRQLESFFGINKKYFGEISDEDQKDIFCKAMFRNDYKGKEVYRFKPESLTDWEMIPITFWGDMETSLDEKYAAAQRKRQDMLKRIDDIIKGDIDLSISDQCRSIERGCDVYGMTSEMMEAMAGMKSYMKMPFYYEICSVWKAMLMAYGLMDTSEVSCQERSPYHCGEDGNWILQLHEILKSHWDQERDYYEESRREFVESSRYYHKKRELQMEGMLPPPKTFEEVVADAEAHYKASLEEQ